MNAETFDLKKHGKDIKEWVSTGITDMSAVTFANNFGQYTAQKKMPTSQIRNVFGEMRRIQMRGFNLERTAFILLKPKLAYAVKRNRNDIMRDFYWFFEKAHDAVSLNDVGAEIRFDNFISLVEAITAYHKFYERD